MSRDNIICAALAVVVVAGAAYYLILDGKVNVAGINNYQECADAGYPVMESYPERCATPDGRTFTREVSNNPVGNPPDASGTNPPTSSPMPVPGSNEPEMIACTMDAMQCPDGTWVGRSGPNCQFVCPGQ